jgi:hypothetical protein
VTSHLRTGTALAVAASVVLAATCACSAAAPKAAGPPSGCDWALAALADLPAFPPTSDDVGTYVSMMGIAESHASGSQAAPVVRLLGYYAGFLQGSASLNGSPDPADLQSWHSQVAALQAWCAGDAGAVSATAAAAEDGALLGHLSALAQRYLLTQAQAEQTATAAGVAASQLARSGSAGDAALSKIEAYANANISGSSSLPATAPDRSHAAG